MEDKRRLLIITYYWPPTGGSGVQRWVKFCKYLPDFGWSSVIYTPENPERLAYDKSLESDIPSDTEVIRTHITEPYALYRKLLGRGDRRQVNPLNSTDSSFKSRLSRWLRGNLFIPDPRVSWVRPSVRYLCKYLKSHPVDAVITTGPPQSMHLIGRELKRRTGITWIADFRDPWTQMFYYKHLNLSKYADKKHHRLEQSILDEADAVIAVSPLVRDDFAAQTSTPVELITNGFDPDDFPKTISTPPQDEKFRIVHTGLFASDGNPINLWSALSDKCREDKQFADRLEIRLAGKTDKEIVDSIKAYGLGSNLINLGYLPHEKVVQEQCNASLLILPLRREPEYSKVLPGKIFEYIASGRPILGIGQEDGAAARVLEDSGAGRMFGWDEKERLLQFMENSHAPADNIEKYSRCELTARLAELLDKYTK